MFNGRAVGHALAGLGILVIGAGLVLIVQQCACTPAQMQQAARLADLAKDVHDCKVLNRSNKAGMNLCMAAVALRYAGESLDDLNDAGPDQ